MNRRGHAAILAALAATSCATVVDVQCKGDPNELLDRYTEAQKARYPATQWILGVGVDSSRPGAEAKAVAAAVAAYAQELHFTSELRTEGARGAEQDDDEPLLAAEAGPPAVIEASRRAEARRRLQGPPEEARNECGRWLAVATTRRAVLDERLANEAKPVEARLRAEADALLGARSWLDAQASWCAVLAAERELETLDLQRWTVARQTVWTEDLKRLRKSARAQRKALRAGVTVLVERRDGDAEAVQLLERALLRGGVIIDEAPAPACAGIVNAIALRPALRAPCKGNAYDFQACRASLRVEAVLCGDGGERALFAAEATGEGTDVTDASYARIRAVAEIDVAAVAGRVKREIDARVEEGCPAR